MSFRLLRRIAITFTKTEAKFRQKKSIIAQMRLGVQTCESDKIRLQINKKKKKELRYAKLVTTSRMSFCNVDRAECNSPKRSIKMQLYVSCVHNEFYRDVNVPRYTYLHIKYV